MNAKDIASRPMVEEREPRVVYQVRTVIERVAPKELPKENVLLSPDDLVAILPVARQTLARWRCYGEGPKFVKIGGRHIAYFADDIRRWLEECNSDP